MLRIILISMFLVVGCSDQETAYVPGPDFFQSIELSVSSSKIAQGSEIVINVSRESGGWINKKQSGFNLNACEFVNTPPPKHEDDVSLNISFVIEPSGNHIFGITDQGKRTAKFNRPGKYILKAHSALWCPPGVDSVVEIEVQ